MTTADPNLPLNVISKATKMVVLGEKITAENTKAVCDYHYDLLISNGTKIYHHTPVFQEAPAVECDYCREGK